MKGRPVKSVKPRARKVASPPLYVTHYIDITSSQGRSCLEVWEPGTVSTVTVRIKLRFKTPIYAVSIRVGVVESYAS